MENSSQTCRISCDLVILNLTVNSLSFQRIISRSSLTLLYLHALHLLSEFLLLGISLPAFLLELLVLQQSQPGGLPHHHLLILQIILGIDTILVKSWHIDHDCTQVVLATQNFTDTNSLMIFNVKIVKRFLRIEFAIHQSKCIEIVRVDF